MSAKAWFSQIEKDLKGDGNHAVKAAAIKLKEQTEAELKANFNAKSPAFKKVKLKELEAKPDKAYTCYVNLNRIQSTFATETTMQGRPWVWILLPQGQALGFKRIGKKNTLPVLRAKYGNKLNL
jgi:uncharacterized lipoprotein YmbA